MRERMQQQHARSRSAASGRVLDQPSGHDPSVHQEQQQILFGTIHTPNVESAHAMVDRALVRGRAGEAFDGSCCTISNLVEMNLDDWR